MASVERVVTISPEEYLEGEKHSDIKHEYVAGQVYAMVGASRAHNIIALNLATALRGHLRGRPCQVFMADVKARIDDLFYYPDVMVSCDPADRHDYYCEHPVLVVEVTSPSTEARDALEKRIAYQSLASLKEYVLVAQDDIKVRVYRRIVDGWELETCKAGDKVRLTAVGLELPIERIFDEAGL